MSITTNDGEEIPRTDLCEDCDREIVVEVESVTGGHELIHRARKADEGWKTVTGGKAVIVFKCGCSHVEVEYGPGSASAWDFPDCWMWESELSTGGGEE